MGRPFVIVGLALFAATASFSGSARAADYAVKTRVAVAAVTSSCGCRCGCLAVTYVRHRQLAMSYGYNLDPRARDEPRYFWGRERAFPRYETVYPVRALD